MRVRRNSENQGVYENLLVWEFFDYRTDGFFVEIGANDPRELSQTWLLEKVGWKGILVEPLPDKSKLLREHRPTSMVFEVAVSSPEEVGEAVFHIAGDRSALVPLLKTDKVDYAGSTRVKVVTANDILEEAGAGKIDFLSIDTEGNEFNVLKGFDIGKYEPSLVLVEDSVYTLDVHNFMRSKGYRLIRRTADNNWYIPGDSLVVPSLVEKIRLFRKIYLGTPLRRWKFMRKQKMQKRDPY